MKTRYMHHSWRSKKMSDRRAPGKIGSAAIVRCGVWPTVLALLVVAVQEAAKPAASKDSPPSLVPKTGATKSDAAPSKKDGSTTTPDTAAATSVKSTKAPSGKPAASPASGASGSSKETPGDATAAKTIPFEYSPYKIHVWVAAEPSPDLDDEVLADIRLRLAQRADVRVGAPWSVTVTAAPKELYYTLAMCPRMLTDAAIGAVKKEVLKDDKLIVVSLSASPREWRVWTREFDCHARTWGSPITRVERQSAALLDTVFDSVVASFGPLARIEDGAGKTCVVRGRATGLITNPDSPAQIVKGDVLQPVFRQNDRFGNPLPGKTEALAFTFLHVTSNDSQFPALLNCNVHSGMRSPIYGRTVSTSRRERWAIKVRPQYS